MGGGRGAGGAGGAGRTATARALLCSSSCLGRKARSHPCGQRRGRARGEAEGRGSAARRPRSRPSPRAPCWRKWGWRGCGGVRPRLEDEIPRLQVRGGAQRLSVREGPQLLWGEEAAEALSGGVSGAEAQRLCAGKGGEASPASGGAWQTAGRACPPALPGPASRGYTSLSAPVRGQGRGPRVERERERRAALCTPAAPTAQPGRRRRARAARWRRAPPRALTFASVIPAPLSSMHLPRASWPCPSVRTEKSRDAHAP